MPRGRRSKCCSISLAIELQQVTEEGLKDRAREGKYWCNTRMELKSTKAQVVLLTEKVRALRAKIARGKARALSGMSETWDNGVFDGLTSQLLQEHGDDGNIWTQKSLEHGDAGTSGTLGTVNAGNAGRWERKSSIAANGNRVLASAHEPG